MHILQPVVYRMAIVVVSHYNFHNLSKAEIPSDHIFGYSCKLRISYP